MGNNIVELTLQEQADAAHAFSLKVAAKAVSLVGPVAIQQWVVANWPPAPSDDLNPEEWAWSFAHRGHLNEPRAYVEPEDACMHAAGTSNGCCERATRFHRRIGESTDEILCDEHAEGKVTIPLATASAAVVAGLSTLDKLRAIIALWDAADMAANVDYYGANLRAVTREENLRLLHVLGYTDSARRNLLRLYALVVADQRRGEDLALRRIAEWRLERHAVAATAAWVGRYLNDTAARLGGTTQLDAPLPTCDDIVTSLSTVPQMVGDATVFYTADSIGPKTTKKPEET